MEREKEGFVIFGEKVSLRKITLKDTALIVKWRNNERVRDNFVFREHFTKEMHEVWFKEKIQKGFVEQFIICENTEGYRPIGSVYFRDIDSANATAEYGIFIGEDDAIGREYGNETALLALDYAKKVLGLKKIILRAFKDNKAAIRSYKNAGFTKIKDLMAVECSDGFKSDMILMEKRF
ncbi:MAG: GNAT family N-acetyltransferase [Butyrivibrio sp.]|nr:GNAT family N-acetyltransferase [Butyrivibrio sp.]